ncbi:MAG: hypothetical protein AAFZ89_12035 [Bacteroidota bacterium]
MLKNLAVKKDGTKMILKTMMFIFIGFLIISCSDNDDQRIDPIGICGVEPSISTIVSSEQFETAPSEELTIDHMSIQGDCLIIGFSAGGCNTENWTIRLIDSGNIMESNPSQRTVRLSKGSGEIGEIPCLALFTQELAFDISNLRVDGTQVLLNIVNDNNTILYRY